MTARTAFLGSARFQRAGDGILSSQTLLGSCTGWKFARNKSSFRLNAEPSTLKACAPQIPRSHPQWMFGL
jgi:hypothetical protein